MLTKNLIFFKIALDQLLNNLYFLNKIKIANYLGKKPKATKNTINHFKTMFINF